MEVESLTSEDATATTEIAGAIAVELESEVGAVQPNDADFGLSSKSVVESDALVAVSSDSEATAAVNNDSMAVDFDNHNQDTPPSATVDGEAVDLPGPLADDVGPSTAAATTSDSILQQDSSFDLATQWSSSAGVDTVQSDRHVNVSHAASPLLLENDSSAATATTATEDVQQKDDELHSAAEVVDEPLHSSTSPQQEPQPQQQPEQLPTEEDVQVQDFKAGITCTDVPTAIDVLNTRFRLADVTIHRNMITWSSWNIADIVRGPHRESFWWRGRRTQRTPVQQQTDSPNSSEFPDEDERSTQHDVEEVCSKIERREREIALMLDTMDRQAADDVITPETVQHQQQTRPGPVSQQQSASSPQTDADKRGNVFQRLLRALRRRFARQRQQQETTTPDQQRQHQQAIQRRQRTL